MTWLCLYSSLIFGCILVTSKGYDVDLANELPHYIRPESYKIKLDLRKIEDGFFKGNCGILIKLDRETNNISFHAQTPIRIFKIHMQDLSKVRPTDLSHEPMNIECAVNLCTLYFNQTLGNGYYSMEILFNNSLYNGEEDPFKLSFSNENESGIWLLNSLKTNYHTIGARRIFPCWDDSLFKANFTIEVAHPDKYNASSNMPVANVKISDKSKMTLFKDTPPIVPSLVAIVVSFPRTHMEVILQCRNQTTLYLKEAEMIIQDVTQHLKLRFESCKELVEVNHVAIPGFHEESMNILGFVFYSETPLMYNRNLVTHETTVAQLIGRAIVYQCMYDLENPILSRSGVRKSIAIFLAADVINKVYPAFRMWELFVVQVQHESLRLDIFSIMKTDIKKLYRRVHSNFFYHIKVPAMLRMLQHILGDEIFGNGIKLLLSKEINENAMKFRDLSAAMKTALDESGHEHIDDIKTVIDVWIELYSFSYPVLKLMQNSLESPVEVFMRDVIQNTEKSVTYAVEDHIKFTNTYTDYYLWAKCNDTHQCYRDGIRFHSIFDWISINTQQTGYYRVYYNSGLWYQIMVYLDKPNEYEKVHVLNRAQLIDDAFHFVMKGDLLRSTFMKLIKLLQQETDYIPWHPMFKALEHMSGFFLLKQSASLKRNIREILHELLKIIKYTENTEEDSNDLIKCLRQEAAKWACLLGDSDCITDASFKLESHLFQNKTLLQDWKTWTYCNGLRRIKINNDEVWWKVFFKSMNDSDNRLLEFLSCTRSPTIVINYLKLFVIESEFRTLKMRSNDHVNIYFLTVAKHVNDDEVLENVLTYFKEIKPSEVNINVALIHIINHVQSEEQLNKIFAFVTDEKNGFLEKLSQTLYGEVNEDMNRSDKIRETTISVVKKKIHLRLSEILNQIVYFKHL